MKHRPAPTSDVLDLDGVAAFAGVAKQRVKVWCRSGKLPSYRVGNSLRVFKEDLREFLKTAPAYTRHGDAVNAQQRVLQGPANGRPFTAKPPRAADASQ
ncbi:MAG TPA: helix-turn-helix domain-containing protein [Polyangiales bacterium]|nr:helix-turn-helix domain-containing protein [Polyangiales bacterium]